MTGYRGPKELCEIDETLLRKLWFSELTDRQVAERFGCHRDTVRNRAARLGLPGRRLARFQATGRTKRPVQ